MLTILSRLFIKDNKNYSSPGVRLAYGTLCGAMGIFFNLLLFAGKLFAGMLTGSIAVTADAFNNLSDAGSSIVTLVGFKLSGQHADTEHPYGHGRIEYIAGLIVAMLILLAGFELLKSSVEKIISPGAPVFNMLSVIILAASILVKAYMYVYNSRTAGRISSAAMRATATDSLSDCIATSAVLLSMFIGKWSGVDVDGICGALVALLILFGGVKAARETISPLLGQPPEKEFVRHIESIVLESEDIVGIHDLVVHDYGPGRQMVSLHAEVPAEGDILKLHDSVDNAEKRLRAELGCDAVIHMDPIFTADEKTIEMKKRVGQAITAVDPTLSFHDFRMVPGPTHTNVIFDVVAPYKLKMTDEELKVRLTKAVGDIDGSLFAVVTVDRDYSGVGAEVAEDRKD